MFKTEHSHISDTLDFKIFTNILLTQQLQSNFLGHSFEKFHSWIRKRNLPRRTIQFPRKNQYYFYDQLGQCICPTRSSKFTNNKYRHRCLDSEKPESNPIKGIWCWLRPQLAVFNVSSKYQKRFSTNNYCNIPRL